MPPNVVAVCTLPLTTLIYPTRYAFWSAAISPAPYVTMVHRTLLVQFRQNGALKTLLFNPSDIERAKQTPFFARLIARYGNLAVKLLSKTFDPLELQLARLGLGPDDVDYVAFDHFHTQDLRRLLGTTDGLLRARFPRAQLLAPRVEWDGWGALHPMQRAWFVADGRRGVREERVVFTADDLHLGDGVMLLRTPGHTSGNQTLFVKTERGVWGASENGTSADNWSPHASRIRGLAAMARHQDLDVVMNANTIEGGAGQYTSMILEKTMVDRVPDAPEFCQMLPTSEVTPSMLSPGLSPTYVHGGIRHGEIVPREPADRPARAPGAHVDAPGNG